ncbi:MAG: PEP-CTERM sorting domain-containing protein [Proteobacteria bacterium]|nr:PEP-CTERM sorting domain-containing protein [Pseudomonadota bacterium]MBU1711202.1 PEP-CTERM sorting domain-containing protein [Pseudomonadota bacterium]
MRGKIISMIVGGMMLGATMLPSKASALTIDPISGDYIPDSVVGSMIYFDDLILGYANLDVIINTSAGTGEFNLYNASTQIPFVHERIMGFGVDGLEGLTYTSKPLGWSQYGNWSITGIPDFGINLNSNYNFRTSFTGGFGAVTIGMYGQDGRDYSINLSNPAPVPEPATMLLFGTGLVGLAGLRRKKK